MSEDVDTSREAEPAARAVATAVLVVGDGLVLILWAVLGLLHHTGGVSARGLFRDAGPILIGWYAAALAFGLYTRSGLGRFVLTWAVGISAGVLLRAIALHRTGNADELAFWGVTLAVTLALLAAWRGLVVAYRRASRSR